MEIVNVDARTFESMLSTFEAFADKMESLYLIHKDNDFRQSFVSVAVCIMEYRQERGKVFWRNTLRRRKIPSETACRLTFQLSIKVCTTFADELQEKTTDDYMLYGSAYLLLYISQL